MFAPHEPTPEPDIPALVAAARTQGQAEGLTALSRRTKLSKQFLASLAAGLTADMRHGTLVAASIALGVPFLGAPAPAAIAQALTYT